MTGLNSIWRAGLMTLALGGFAGAAGADVTPEEVWQHWQDFEGLSGVIIVAESTERQGDTLIVSGIRQEAGTGPGAMSMLIEEIRFRDQGDGTVAIEFPETFPVILTFAPDPDIPGAKAAEVIVTVAAPGAKITASGEWGAVSYVTDAPKIHLAAEVPEDWGRFTFKLDLEKVAARSLFSGTPEASEVTADYSVAALDLAMDGTDYPQRDGRIRFSIADLALKTTMTGIPPEGMGDIIDPLPAGMEIDLSMRYGVGSFDLDIREIDAPVKLTGALGGGTTVVSMGRDHFAYDETSKSIALNFSGGEGTTGQEMTMSANLADTSSRMTIEGTNWMESMDFEAALAAGMKMSAGFGIGSASFDFAGEDALGATRAKASLGGLDTHFAMDAGTMAYDLAAKAVELAMSSPDIPMREASVTLTEMELGMDMPMEETGVPAPFSLLLRVVDLGLGDDIWAMMDGAGMLPHDPVTLILDTKGMLTLLEDLSQAGETLDEGVPQGMLNSIELSDLWVKAAGAEVKGLGSFTFDTSDLTTFPGMPLPTGKLDLAGQGIIGLMDKLVVMGFMTGEEAMGMRMMAGAFARIDPVKDEITSALEFKDGHFYANGAMVQ